MYMYKSVFVKVGGYEKKKIKEENSLVYREIFLAETRKIWMLTRRYTLCPLPFAAILEIWEIVTKYDMGNKKNRMLFFKWNTSQE